MVINGIGNNLSNEDFLMKFAVFKKKKMNPFHLPP